MCRVRSTTGSGMRPCGSASLTSQQSATEECRPGLLFALSTRGKAMHQPIPQNQRLSREKKCKQADSEMPDRKATPPSSVTTVKRTWHMSANQGKILALVFREKSGNPFSLFPPRSVLGRDWAGRHSSRPSKRKTAKKVVWTCESRG